MSNNESASRTIPRWERSAVKAFTYRIVIICLDFAVIYLLTGKVRTALGFMVISNIYTTAAFILHERIWAGIAWGLSPDALA